MRTLHGKRFVDKQVDIFFWTKTMIRTANINCQTRQTVRPSRKILGNPRS